MELIEDTLFKYQPEIKRLTKSNSFLVGNRVIYIAKKEHTGKASKYFYIAYDYETKIQLAFNTDKEELKKYLEGKSDELEILIL